MRNQHTCQKAPHSPTAKIVFYWYYTAKYCYATVAIATQG
ncbi:hypothetical protein ALT785_770218 [Alteromonas infernus]